MSPNDEARVVWIYSRIDDIRYLFIKLAQGRTNPHLEYPDGREDKEQH